jgi:tripartite-type tricarboxylate transporter receptor subunit TctC
MWEYLIDQIEAATGAKFLRVPFQGGKPGIVALLGGTVDIAQGFYGEFESYLQANQVKPIAVASSRRLGNMKDVATFNEIFGTKDIVWNIIRLAVVPKGTPADRKAYLAAMINAAVRTPALSAEFAKLGAYADPLLTNPATAAAELDKMAQAERAFYVKTGRLK